MGDRLYWLDVTATAPATPTNPLFALFVTPPPTDHVFIESRRIIVNMDDPRAGANVLGKLSPTPYGKFRTEWPSVYSIDDGAFAAAVIPLWFPVLLVAVPTAMCWWRDRRRFPPGHCRRCGYNLTGNVSGRCPECGTECAIPPASDPPARS